jgi:hypothetical protein
MELLRDAPRGQQALWEMVERRVLRLLPLDAVDAPRVAGLMAARAGRKRLGVSEASLVHVAQREELRTVLTLRPGAFAEQRVGARGTLKCVP